MKLHEFQQKFAKTLPADRMKIVDGNKLGNMCLMDVDRALLKLDQKIGDIRLEQNELLKKVEVFFK
ncbi:hypothetical protein LCGC14_0972490 [marine sediment metagenome]|uniref:Uncharacterized protein n=1 Tax=marine sediment metagenome TaxID=412755 RepID=A0A0F9NXJ5_9ZZZZ